jgi:hypothetical protein
MSSAISIQVKNRAAGIKIEADILFSSALLLFEYRISPELYISILVNEIELCARTTGDVPRLTANVEPASPGSGLLITFSLCEQCM